MKRCIVISVVCVTLVVSVVSVALLWYLLSVWHWSDIQPLKHDGDISGHCYLVLFWFLLFRWLGKTIGYRNMLRRAFRLHQKIGGGARGFLCFLLLLGLLQKGDMFISSEITSSQTQKLNNLHKNILSNIFCCIVNAVTTMYLFLSVFTFLFLLLAFVLDLLVFFLRFDLFILHVSRLCDYSVCTHWQNFIIP